ncbi:MAG: asparagine synthase-related protein, partial [Bacteroidota bacterium]
MRDRFGQKPLFYTIQGDRLIFASEMKALLPFLSEVRAAKNFAGMAKEMRAYEATEDCLVEGIQRLPAGHHAVWRDGKLTVTRWWNTLEHRVEVPPTFEGQVAEFRRLLEAACRLRMRSDVQIGTGLSGGLDSAAILTTVARLGKDRNDWQNAFTATFLGLPYDEFTPARQVADAVKVPLTPVRMNPKSGLDQLRDMLWHFEELHDTSPVPMVQTYGAMRAAGVKVALDGHGADELMGGYGEGLFHAFGDCRFNLRKARSILDAFQHFYPRLAEFARPSAGWPQYFAYLLRGGRDLPKALVADIGHFNTYLHGLFHDTILPVMLRNYDRYSMMHGVEVRMPFLDHRLVSFVFSLPWHSKLRAGYTKALLRHAMAGQVPEAIRMNRQKIGFTSPTLEWLRGPWKEFFLDFAGSKLVRESTLVDGAEVLGELEKMIKG